MQQNLTKKMLLRRFGGLGPALSKAAVFARGEFPTHIDLIFARTIGDISIA
jgi:hypothetical protein